jgi:hypothetical protein
MSPDLDLSPKLSYMNNYYACLAVAPKRYSRVEKNIDLEFSYEICRLSALLIRSITLTYDLADPLQWEMWLEELRGIMHDMYDRASHYAQVDSSYPLQIHV